MTTAAKRTRDWDTTRTRDHLGRVWSHDKLDRLLEDPQVAAVVDEFEAALYDAAGHPKIGRGETWAYGQGRSESEFALLIMLWYRRLPARYGRSA
ncbi:hypothetical protein ACN9MF_20435 [Methylobacterium fujisawaense]|uniref:hypothetical protein n=1 Tax=Methylobacterium fujisawaense TaxID=107400 RepID=UPI003CE800AF